VGNIIVRHFLHIRSIRAIRGAPLGVLTEDNPPSLRLSGAAGEGSEDAAILGAAQ
jgi:hypothetical protein